MQFDHAGRTWVLTGYHEASGTTVDVFDRLAYLGSIELNGRVLSIQVADSVLVALAESRAGDADLPARRLDWYRIGR